MKFCQNGVFKGLLCSNFIEKNLFFSLKCNYQANLSSNMLANTIEIVGI